MPLQLTGAAIARMAMPAGRYITVRNHPAGKWLENGKNRWAAFSHLTPHEQLTIMSERSKNIPHALFTSPKVASVANLLVGSWTVKPQDFADLGDGNRIFRMLVRENLINRSGALLAGAMFPKQIQNRRLEISLGQSFDNVIATISATQSWRPDEAFAEKVMREKPSVFPLNDYGKRAYTPEALQRLMLTGLNHSCGDVFEKDASLDRESLSLGSVILARGAKAISEGTIEMLRGINVESLMDRPMICLALDILTDQPNAMEEYQSYVGVNPLLRARFTSILKYVAFWS